MVDKGTLLKAGIFFINSIYEIHATSVKKAQNIYSLEYYQIKEYTEKYKLHKTNLTSCFIEIKSTKKSIRDACTPQPREIVFDTMRDVKEVKQ